MKDYAVGIDLGTSHCSLGWVNASDKVELLRDDTGDPLVPSAVYFRRDGSVAVGKAAMEEGAEDPDRLLQETKRVMGDTSRRWRLDDGSEYEPKDVAAILLRRLRLDFEARVGPIRRAVIGVPTNYNLVQRKLTKAAVLEAGLPTQELVNEPLAAALTQILDGEPTAYLVLADRQLLLVYDLGGGTFDLNVVEYDRRRICVVASDGKLELGGADWNRRLEANVALRMEATWGVRVGDHRKWRHALRTWAEQTELPVQPARPDAGRFRAAGRQEGPQRHGHARGVRGHDAGPGPADRDITLRLDAQGGRAPDQPADRRRRRNLYADGAKGAGRPVRLHTAQPAAELPARPRTDRRGRGGPVRPAVGVARTRSCSPAAGRPRRHRPNWSAPAPAAWASRSSGPTSAGSTAC